MPRDMSLPFHTVIPLTEWCVQRTLLFGLYVLKARQGTPSLQSNFPRRWCCPRSHHCVSDHQVAPRKGVASWPAQLIIGCQISVAPVWLDNRVLLLLQGFAKGLSTKADATLFNVCTDLEMSSAAIARIEQRVLNQKKNAGTYAVV